MGKQTARKRKIQLFTQGCNANGLSSFTSLKNSSDNSHFRSVELLPSKIPYGPLVKEDMIPRNKTTSRFELSRNLPGTVGVQVVFTDQIHHFIHDVVHGNAVLDALGHVAHNNHSFTDFGGTQNQTVGDFELDRKSTRL